MGLYEITGMSDTFCYFFGFICDIEESMVYANTKWTDPIAMNFLKKRKAGGASVK